MEPVAARLQQTAKEGALATVRAAVDPDAAGGDFYGPSRFFGLTGDPVPIEPAAAARDKAVQRMLWRESELLTGVKYPV